MPLDFLPFIQYPKLAVYSTHVAMTVLTCGERSFQDMDAWGYSFRLGSARAWFERDAEDARTWLLEQGLIDDNARPTWRVRGQVARYNR